MNRERLSDKLRSAARVVKERIEEAKRGAIYAALGLTAFALSACANVGNVERQGHPDYDATIAAAVEATIEAGGRVTPMPGETQGRETPTPESQEVAQAEEAQPEPTPTSTPTPVDTPTPTATPTPRPWFEGVANGREVLCTGVSCSLPPGTEGVLDTGNVDERYRVVACSGDLSVGGIGGIGDREGREIHQLYDNLEETGAVTSFEVNGGKYVVVAEWGAHCAQGRDQVEIKKEELRANGCVGGCDEVVEYTVEGVDTIRQGE